MTVEFPEQNQTIFCPHCSCNCAFALGASQSYDITGGRVPGRHGLHFAYCQSCGGCIIGKNYPAGAGRVIYPTAPTRSKASDEIKQLAKGPAENYDEAVECEPFSKRAAVFLLGRCTEIMLVEKLNAPKGKTLGKQINDTIEAKTLKEPLAGWLQKAFKPARDQSGHYWTDSEGNEMTIDDETVNQSFAVIDYMFREFYIQPAEMARLTKKMQTDRTEKLKGDKVCP